MGVLTGSEHQGCKGMAGFTHSPESQTPTLQGGIPDPLSQVVKIDEAFFPCEKHIGALELEAPLPLVFFEDIEKGS